MRTVPIHISIYFLLNYLQNIYFSALQHHHLLHVPVLDSRCTGTRTTLFALLRHPPFTGTFTKISVGTLSSEHEKRRCELLPVFICRCQLLFFDARLPLLPLPQQLPLVIVCLHRRSHPSGQRGPPPASRRVPRPELACKCAEDLRAAAPSPAIPLPPRNCCRPAHPPPVVE